MATIRRKISNEKKILIIEDDDLLRQLCAKKLTSEGFKTIQSAGGKEGLHLAQFYRPSLIVLDIMLPGGLNGFDVLEALKKNPDLVNIPVIVLTNLDSEKNTALAIGAVDYVVKANISIDDFVDKVKTNL